MPAISEGYSRWVQEKKENSMNIYIEDIMLLPSHFGTSPGDKVVIVVMRPILSRTAPFRGSVGDWVGCSVELYYGLFWGS